MTDAGQRQFAAKSRWHHEQRQLSPRMKVGIVIELQKREAEANRIRAALGRPILPMRPWTTEP